jgi:hypothetical protein
LESRFVIHPSTGSRNDSKQHVGWISALIVELVFNTKSLPNNSLDRLFVFFSKGTSAKKLHFRQAFTTFALI